MPEKLIKQRIEPWPCLLFICIVFLTLPENKVKELF